MSDFITTTIPFKGKEYTLDILTGIVIDTETRSDTYVSGSGSSASYNGTGGGHVNISSAVVVTKDIWVRSLSGKEYRYQMGDVEARAGNIVCLGIIADELLIFSNETTENNWTFLDKIKKSISKFGMGMVMLFSAPFCIWIFSAFYNPGQDRGFLGSLIISCLLGMVPGFISALAFLTIKQKIEGPQFKKLLEKEFWRFQAQMNEAAMKLKSTPAIAPAAATGSSFCSGCGNSFEPNAKFCGGCGSSLAAA